MPRKNIQREFLVKFRSVKYKLSDAIFDFKYQMNDNEKSYILSKINPNQKNSLLSNPLPQSEDLINGKKSTFYLSASIYQELKWYLFHFQRYIKEINRFIEINNDIENSLLKSDFDNSLYLLDELENSVCSSFYSIITEMYINDLNDNAALNKEIIQNLTLSNADSKLVILLEFARLRMDSKVSSWQYDYFISQHKKQYVNDEYYTSYKDYIEFKLTPFPNIELSSSIPFILFLDSEFSVIDRYCTFKKIMPVILDRKLLNESELDDIMTQVKNLSCNIKDPYLKKLLLFQNPLEINASNRLVLYKNVEDNFLKGNYNIVVDEIKFILNDNPNYSELYILFAQSIILTSNKLNKYIKEDALIYELIALIISVLNKGENYFSDRDKLVEKYYSLQHLSFSYSIMEFLYNEYNVSLKNEIVIESFLFSYPIRYNFSNLFDNSYIRQFADKNKGLNSEVFNFVSNTVENLLEVSPNNFLCQKILINALIKFNLIDEALTCLNQFKNIHKYNNIEFIQTWIIKSELKCHLNKKDYEEIANIVVDYFLERNIAYDHFFNQQILGEIYEVYGDECSTNISIPILFQIYNQPQNIIYDSIANFLISQSVFKPSDILSFTEKFPLLRLSYFIEKVCTKENIEDSPFINTIEELEKERIILLNFLKKLNPLKSKNYNEEILDITKQSNLRKGLLQIHESRIYIDVTGIYKNIDTELKETFDRYLEFTDIFSNLPTLKMNDSINSKETYRVTYYFKKPVIESILNSYLSTHDPRFDPNAVTVPHIRFLYYVNMFYEIKDKFVLNENFGLKSFLSMRIRHGTFSNILRGVFEKYSLCTKESGLGSYNDVKYWNEVLDIAQEPISEIQKLIKEFSKEIDSHIDLGLSWIDVTLNDNSNENAVLDFIYTEDELYGLFHNRIGRIDKYEDFFNEVINVLYERLDILLNTLRYKISKDLKTRFLSSLDSLSKDIERLRLKEKNNSIIEQKIISCRTDVQSVITQIENWFNISTNQYIEEFTIDMILETSLDYVDSINNNALTKANVSIVNNCNLKFNGDYFESFGDILFNLFNNIIENNSDLQENLNIEISVDNTEDEIKFIVKNNLSKNIDFNDLECKVYEITEKINNYINGSIISFEQGSGYLKICKSIATDLDRAKYKIVPKCTHESFEVSIEFNYLDLVI